jgi:hypothetical protein
VTPIAVDADHVMIIGNRAAHGGDKTVPDDYNDASTISGFIVTDKPVVSMSPQPVAAVTHDTVNLRTIAAGVPPLSYQWRNGGTPIAGATTTGYSIPNISLGGNYDVVVTNLYGSTTSKVSAVTIDRIAIIPGPDVGTNAISWKAVGAVLQSAPSVNGPYTDIDPPATSPYLAPIDSTQQFYRYRYTTTILNSNPYDM